MISLATRLERFTHYTLKQKALAIMAALAGIFCLYQVWVLLWVIIYTFFNPWNSSVMKQETDLLHEQKPDAKVQFIWVNYPNISTQIKKAVIASEDSGFINHNGIEWDAIAQAWEYNEKQEQLGKTKIRGGSTITQQVAKNLFLSTERSYLRKGQEVIISYMLEALMSKERILEIYLNIAEWGEGIFGIQAASQHYYRMPASKLNASQAATLAAMLPNPKGYENRRTSYFNAQVRRVLARMRLVEIPDNTN